MVVIKTFFDLSGSVIRVAAWDMDPIDEFDAYQLLFLTTFAIFLFIMTIIQYNILDPNDFRLSLEKSMVVDFTKYKPKHQLHTHPERRNSNLSAPYARAKYAKLDDMEFKYVPDYTSNEETPVDGNNENNEDGNNEDNENVDSEGSESSITTSKKEYDTFSKPAEESKAMNEILTDGDKSI